MDKLTKQNKAVRHFKTGTQIGLGAFLAMTASMVLTVYEYPTFAESGWACVLFLIISGLCYFLPVAIAAAEMGTVRKWSKDGVYVWIKHTLGRRWGWYAIFCQWSGITIAFLAMLYFVISGLGFIFAGTQGFNVLTEQVGDTSSFFTTIGNQANTTTQGVVSLAQPIVVISGTNWAPALVASSAINSHTLSLLEAKYGYDSAKWIQIAADANAVSSFVPFYTAKGAVDSSNLAYIFANGAYSNIEFSNLQLNGVGVGVGGNNSISLAQLATTPLVGGSSANKIAMYESGCIFGVACLLLVVWTCAAHFGVKWIAENARIGFWGGIACPTLILVIMGFVYVGRDLSSSNEIIRNIPWANLTGGSSVPAQGSMFTRGFNGANAMITFTAIAVAFAGPEGSGNVAYSLKKVERNYPIAVIGLMFMSVSFSMCGGLFIALGTTGAINGTGGVSVTFMKFFLVADPGMCVPMAETASRIIMVFICWGILAQVGAWIVGPSAGMSYAASQRIIPAVFAKRNRWGIAWVVVWTQLGLVILWEFIMTIILGGVAGVPGSFDAGLQSFNLIYLIVYFLMFVGDARLWTKAPHIPRAFSIKKKSFAIFLDAIGVGIMAVAWCASWIDQIGPGTAYIWFPTIVCIMCFDYLVGIIAYEWYRAYSFKKLCEKYGFNIHDYPEEVRSLARKLFMLKLNEENVPEINEYFKDPELKDATPEELDEERKLRAAEKASKTKKVAVAA